jgi:DNA-binding beta-propeller fold protein YncE
MKNKKVREYYKLSYLIVLFMVSCTLYNPFLATKLNSKNSSATTTTVSTTTTTTLPSGYVETIAGTVGVFGSTDTAGLSAKFYYPDGLVTDSLYIYVTDSYNHTLRRINKQTFDVVTIAGVSGVPGTSDGIGTSASFNNLCGLTILNNNLYISDWYNHAIRKVDLSSMSVSTIAGNLGISGFSDGIGSLANFHCPLGITNDGTYLYVCDDYNHVIRKIDLSTNNVTTIAGTCLTALFYQPAGITYSNNCLYICEYLNCTIRKIDLSTNTVSTIAGSAFSIGSTDGIGVNARFNHPIALTNDGSNIYVTDQDNDIIRKINILTNNVVKFSGLTGVAGSTDGLVSLATFYRPYGIINDGSVLYVSDFCNHTIRKVYK